MIKIYLCDDNRAQLDYWYQIIHDYLEFNETNANIELQTRDPEELLIHLHSSDGYTGLYFLNINFKGDMNGIQLAAQIRRLDPRGYIVFITSHSEMSYLTFQYKVEAMDFILKDMPDDIPLRIRNCIDTALLNQKNRKKKIKNTWKVKVSIDSHTQELILTTGKRCPFSLGYKKNIVP